MYIHTDHLGSTNVSSDESGAQTELVDYYPYGGQRISTGSHTSQKKYIGEHYDPETNLNYLNARYYKSPNGQFISQDSMFWQLPTELLVDPQQQNSYSYARGNPVNGSDPTGLFNIKSGTVEKGDTLSQITSLLNQNNNTSYTVNQVAELNNIKDINKITVGQTLIPNNSVPDITKSLTSQMEINASNWKINNPLYFRKQVKNGGDWDLKNTDQYSSKAYSDGFVFLSKHIERDAPGNIHYGYVGSAIFWSTSKMLFKQAGRAQVLAGTSLPEWSGSPFYGDSPQDRYNINWGMSLYKSNR
jgi:RHS repeat-associated protein